MYHMWRMMQVGTSNCVPHMAHDAVKVLITCFFIPPLPPFICIFMHHMLMMYFHASYVDDVFSCIICWWCIFMHHMLMMYAIHHMLMMLYAIYHMLMMYFHASYVDDVFSCIICWWCMLYIICWWCMPCIICWWCMSCIICWCMTYIICWWCTTVFSNPWVMPHSYPNSSVRG